MADKIKHIAAFSEDAIAVGLQTLTEDQWANFKIGLDVLSSSLGKKDRRKTELKESKMSDESIFKEHILVQIQKRVIEAEKHETDRVLSIIVDHKIRTDYTACSIEEMLNEHTTLVQTEEGLKAMLLITQFSRGLLYLKLIEKLKKKGSNLREFMDKGNLSVAYMTVMRYMTLTTILLKYPRLLLCQLNFTQLLKHKKRLLNYLSQKEGHDLNCRLSIPFEVIANGHKIQISHEEIMTPAEKFNTNPDWAFHDMHTKSETTDEEVQAILESRSPVDEEAELNQIM